MAHLLVMCMFSGPVEHVANTRIFARMLDGAPVRQALIYAMQMRTAAEVAMILPVPTPAGASEQALRFVSLEGRASFFDQLEASFPALVRPDPFATDSREHGFRGGAPILEVHQVGAFEASFVPSQADFNRLDRRFRLPAKVLSKLPYEQSWGYAVFKLRGALAQPSASPKRGWFRRRESAPRDRESALDQNIHPMAFVFETRRPQALFFPTIHVHDGALTKLARFDHQLYFQAGDDPELQDFMLPKFALIRPDPSNTPWWPEDFDPRVQVLHRSRGVLGGELAIDDLVEPERHAWRYTLEGTGPNQDIEILLKTSLG